MFWVPMNGGNVDLTDKVYTNIDYLTLGDQKSISNTKKLKLTSLDSSKTTPG